MKIKFIEMITIVLCL